MFNANSAGRSSSSPFSRSVTCGLVPTLRRGNAYGPRNQGKDLHSHAGAWERGAQDSKTTKGISMLHGGLPVWHGTSPMLHGALAVQHSGISVQHSPVPVQHSPVSVQHSPVSVQHSPVSVQHSPVSVQHSPVSVQHSPVSVKHGEAPKQLVRNRQDHG